MENLHELQNHEEEFLQKKELNGSTEGEWVKVISGKGRFYDFYKCSKCGYRLNYLEETDNYCANCGTHLTDKGHKEMQPVYLISSNGTEICAENFPNIEEARKALRKETGRFKFKECKDEKFSYISENSAYLCPLDTDINEDWVWEIIGGCSSQSLESEPESGLDTYTFTFLHGLDNTYKKIKIKAETELAAKKKFYAEVGDSFEHRILYIKQNDKIIYEY